METTTHHEHHHGELPVDGKLNRIFIVGIILNTLYVVVEGGAGFYYDSMGLLSDAGHNLSDVFSLLLALLAFRLSKTPANPRYTYGYKKSSILISLLNAIILLIAVGAIIVECIYKFKNPVAVNGEAISWTAGVGILINGFTAWMLLGRKQKDMNVKGAYLHMAADTLVSVGVLISGIAITLTGYVIIDPLISLVIAVVILVSTWKLLSESLRLSLDGVPDHIKSEKVYESLLKYPGVEGVHHLHIWAISTTQNALTAHIILSDFSQQETVKCRLRDILKEEGIDHVTLEFEKPDETCEEEGCL